MSKKRIQLTLVFDLTGSMAACRGEVRANNCRLVAELFKQFPGIEIAIIVVGDDPEHGRYMIRHIGFTTDMRQLVNFINTVPNANGGDADECYEWAFNKAATFEWDPDASKVMVVFGDSVPHSVHHVKNPLHFDWKEQVAALVDQGVTIHAVQCLADYGGTAARNFWTSLAELGKGIYLTLAQFRHVENLLLGIAHRAVGLASLQAFTERLERDGSISVGLQENFGALLGKRRERRSRRDGKIPEPDSRFQVLRCTAADRQDVRAFAVDKGLIEAESDYNAMVKGRLYYAHTERTETLRPDHHVVIQEVATDTFFSGEAARNWLEIPYGSSGKLRPNPLGSEYIVWVQSKSVNRKLNPKQQVMVDMTEAAPILA